MGAVRFGELLVLMGIIATVLAGVDHWFALRRMKTGELPNAYRWPLSSPSPCVLRFLERRGCGG